MLYIFYIVGVKDALYVRKIVDSRWFHRYNSDEIVNYVKMESRMVAKRFSQILDILL